MFQYLCQNEKANPRNIIYIPPDFAGVATTFKLYIEKKLLLFYLLVMKPVNIDDDSKGVDKTLIKAFLKMTPEDRLLSNDNTIRTILELRNAVKHGRKRDSRKSE